HRDAALVPGTPTFLDRGVVDVAAEHKGTIKYPLLFRSGLEFVLVRFTDALLHMSLFYPLGGNSVIAGTILAPSGHPAFIPMGKPRGPQPGVFLDRWPLADAFAHRLG